MKKNWKFATMALIAGVSLFATSCSSDEDPVNNPGDGGEDTYVLDSDITENVTLETGKTYTLNGGVHVKSGATLTIQPGVTIVAQHDETVDYILIEQGAKIDAQGTAAQPIVMTSEKKEAGAWGGLHICGYAHTNNGSGKSEIGNAPYGGNNDADDSGTLKYIRLEYTGYAFDEEHEANGVSFYGVGNGTTVEHLQAYQGSDDGFEFFGGSVNVKYMVVTSCSDDSFDWTEGWNGKAQFLVAYQEGESSLGYACDCLMECDNNGTNNAATPVAHPTIANATLIGNGGDAQGVRLRAGTQVELYNTIITGKGKPLTVETNETENALKDGTSKLEYVAISGELSSKQGIYTNADFTQAAGNLTNQEFSWTGKYVGTLDGGKDLSADSFFTKTDYKGAVKSGDDWTSGWTL
ncbi:hypothetical protein [Phocaeicola coprocola]|uniref:hypothetical protein n=1 Tax=Phocaeicola coprocola TaxID=310298 RepID=UPI001C38DB53|nr:hypothetical protein [Phocaeicola coprocola]MBV3868018.1 hypothetical protein [Phocaeicola coprocola]MBV4008959.1 hypothetical protein [Phocaeicola coprocola]MBV4033447.1 hypothetical protein [Phocaeicola coprocola]MBV4040014.1 hypothetical protein [Phocaeicola coprocola]MBV4061649.1 hypothetical protein [Phocaeicola coprocola]